MGRILFKVLQVKSTFYILNIFKVYIFFSNFKIKVNKEEKYEPNYKSFMSSLMENFVYFYFEAFFINL